jgi:magnesium and cobalt transporter
VDAEEVEMIESVMEFGDTRAAEIMTPRTDVFALPVDTPWETAVSSIHHAGHTRVPIYEDNLDNIVGIIYAKDLLKFIGHQPPSDLKSICRKPYFVPDSKCLDDLLKDFKTRKVHIAVVLDEYGGTAGVVTIEDVLEEIVGEISDEYDKTQDEQVLRVSEDTLDVEGRLRVDELNDELDIKLPDDENYDTVAGFAAAYLGYIPPAGEKFTAFGAEFTVLQADERKISQLRVKKINTDEKDSEK